MRQRVLQIVQVVFILIVQAQCQSDLYCKGLECRISSLLENDYLINEGWKSWNQYGENGSLYHFVSSPLSNNTEAESYCAKYGTKLSTAKSREEILFLQGILPDLNSRTVYIGLNRNALGSTDWVWNDEEVVTDQIWWSPGFPQKEHTCGCIYCNQTYCGVVSSPCDEKKEFICKYAIVSEIFNVSIFADVRDAEIQAKQNEIPLNWLKNLTLRLLPNVDWTNVNLSYTRKFEGNIIRIELMIYKFPMDSTMVSAIEYSARNIRKTPTQHWSFRSYGNGALIKPSSEAVVEGTLFHLNCTCQVKTVAVLEWVYEGFKLNEKNANNIQFKVTHNDTRGLLSSTLTFQPILKNDSGLYECIVTTYMGCTLARSEIRVYVRVLAVVEVFPFTQMIEKGSNASISCALRNNAEQVSFLWYRDGTQLGNKSGFTVSLINKYTSHLYITNVAESAIYSCRGNNTDGLGKEAISNVDVILDFTIYCKANIDESGTTWSIGYRGITYEQTCPNGFTGRGTRFCNADGIWEDPNYDQCVNNVFVRLQKELENRVAITNLSTVLETLMWATDLVNTKLHQAEIEITVSILNGILDIIQIDKVPASEEMYENFLHAASNIVDETTSASWQSLISKKQLGAETVLRTVETFVEGLSQSVSNESSFHLTLRTKNIDVEIGQKLPLDFPSVGDDYSQDDANFSNSLSLPSQKNDENTDQYTYAVAFYRNLSRILQKKILKKGQAVEVMDNFDIGPVVMSVQLHPRPDKLTTPLRLMFQTFDVETNYTDPLCTYWSYNVSDDGDEGWSSEGCRIISRSSSGVVCECNHLTNFAILMTPFSKVTTADHEASLSIISAIGCAVSLTCLVLTIIGHLYVWRHVKSPRRYILMNFSVALILSYMTFLAGVNRTENKDVCTAIAALLHYFYLTVFSIMLVEGIWIAVSVLYVFHNRSYLHLLLPVGWLIPAGIVGVSLGVRRLDGYGNKQFCWLSVQNGLIWAFVGPAALVIVFNIVVIIIAIRKMLGTTAFLTKTKKEQIRASLKSLGVLLPITGVTWILGIFSLNEDLVVFQYLFTIFNSLQGLFIFMFHCLKDDQLRNAIKTKCQRTKATEINYLNLRTASRDEFNNEASAATQQRSM